MWFECCLQFCYLFFICRILCVLCSLSALKVYTFAKSPLSSFHIGGHRSSGRSRNLPGVPSVESGRVLKPTCVWSPIPPYLLYHVVLPPLDTLHDKVTRQTFKILFQKQYILIIEKEKIQITEENEIYAENETMAHDWCIHVYLPRPFLLFLHAVTLLCFSKLNQFGLLCPLFFTWA